MLYFSTDSLEVGIIIEDAITKLSEKGFYDYFSVIVPSVLTVIVIVQSVYFFKKTNEQKSIQFIVEKELERIYEATDNFFEFCDKSGLYFSLEKYKNLRLLDGQTISQDFAQKIHQSNIDVTSSFSNIKRSIFILHSLGFSVLATRLKAYEDSVVRLRSNIIEFDSKGTMEGARFSQEQLVHLLQCIGDTYEDIRVSLLVEIHKCQEHLLKVRVDKK